MNEEVEQTKDHYYKLGYDTRKQENGDQTMKFIRGIVCGYCLAELVRMIIPYCS